RGARGGAGFFPWGPVEFGAGQPLENCERPGKNIELVKGRKTALIQEISTAHTADSLAGQLRGEPGVVCLRSALFDSRQANYSFVAARPFLTFRSYGSRCELCCLTRSSNDVQVQYGNPWHLLDSLMSRYELLE